MLVSAFEAPTLPWALLLVLAAVVLMRPDGLVVEVPHDRLLSATTKSNSIRFVRDDGALLIFARNPGGERVLRALEEVAPAVARDRIIEPAACTSCRPQW